MIAEAHTVAWIEVLDRIERSLAASLALVPESELAPSMEGKRSWNPLPKVDDHRIPLEERLVSAEAGARETDMLLSQAVQDVQHWLDAVGKARQRLTNQDLGTTEGEKTPPEERAEQG